MTKDERRSAIVAVALTTGAAGCAALSPILWLPALLLLQWVRNRLGDSTFVVASLLALVGAMVFEIIGVHLAGSPWTVVNTGYCGLILVAIGGWLSIVWMELLGWRFLYRLLAVSAVAGLLLFPSVWALLRWDGFMVPLEKEYMKMWTRMSEVPGMIPAMTGTAEASKFFELLKMSFQMSILLMFFFLWTLTGRLSKVFTNESRTLKDFFVPPQGAAVLLGLWGALLVQGFMALRGVNWDWGYLQYVLLNVAWIALVVYALAGWGIVTALMERWKWPRLAQSLARVVIVLTLLSPGSGQIVVLVGLSILAVLELWVNLRNRQGVGL